MFMHKIARLKTNPKLLIPLVAIVFIVTAVFLSIRAGGGEDALTEAIEGGELTLTSINMNNQSITQFAENDEEQARQLLEAARASLDNAEAKLSAAGRANDPYVHTMLVNYQTLSGASDVMSKGVNNLLAISDNLESAINHYLQGEYENASAEASQALQILTPLLSDFEKYRSALSGLDYSYIPSGQRDRVKQAVSQYEREMEIYKQYVLLLKTLLNGTGYLNLSKQIEEYMQQLQRAVNNGDYETAQNLRQKISEILQSLKNSTYQNAADMASQLDPNLLGGSTSDVAQDLRTRLKNLEGLEDFENYLQSLRRYLEASNYLEQGKPDEAEQAVNEGLGVLEQGQGGDPQLQGFYTALREAFNSLRMRIRGQPDQG